MESPRMLMPTLNQSIFCCFSPQNDTTVKCWGWNINGQLGQGDTSTRGDGANEMGTNLPSVDLGPGRTAVAVAAGPHTSCALLDDATLKCWGYNGAGNLGLGDTSNRGDDANEMGANLPAVDLGSGRTAVAIGVGSRHTCALLDDATIKCWGHNDCGQLGLGDTKNRGDDANEMGTNLASVDLGAGRTAVAVSAGNKHTCALLDDATVKCWGWNIYGQLGLGHTENQGVNANEMGDNFPAVLFCGCSVGTPINVVSAAGITSMSSCACPARFTGDAAASGGSCVACTAGTYKSVMGSAVCTSCPSNAVSAEGSINCGCPAGFTGDAASGGSCTACVAGTYTSGMDSAACSTCPAGKYAATAGTADCSTCPSGSSVSVTGSVAVTACICSLGYTGGDGGPCTGCGAGTYKDATGSAACAACPSGSFASGASASACTSCGANTASAEGSTASSDCGCAPGFWGDASSGKICTACLSGTYKDFGGAAECSSCPEKTPQSVPGSTAVGDCVVAISTITFSARVQMSEAEFEAEATSAAYILGVATALGVAETSVSIVSVVEQSTGRRRKLLLTSVVVETSVIVSARLAGAVAGRITTDNLNSALSSAGISVDEVSGISTATGTSALSAWGIVGISVGVAVVGVALVAASVFWRRRRSRGSAGEFSSQVSASLGYFGKVDAFGEAALSGAVRRRKHLNDAAKEASAKELVSMLTAAVAELGGEVRVHNTGKFSPLVFGKFDEATTAMEDFLRVDSKEHLVNLARGEFGIVSEIEKMVAGVRDRVAPKVSSQWGEVGARDEPAESPGGLTSDGLAPLLSEEEKTLLEQAEQLSECLDYVLHREAGSSDLVFDNGGLKRDCDTDGNRLPSREIVDPVTGKKRGMRFDDF
ncbi:hypothetical protein T484DRAFT_1935230, partial [Baffinella frigidus]